MSSITGSLAVARHGEGTSTLPPLVVLHGGGPGCHAAADFWLLLPYLQDRDLILIDLPGYGGSPLPATPGARMSGCAQAVLEVLDELGVETFDVLAQSLGGIVALVLSARHPGRLRRLVAFGSQPVPAPEGIRVDMPLGLRARTAYYTEGETSPERLRESVMTLEWHDPSRIPDELTRMRHAASVTPASLAVAADPNLLGGPEDLTGLLAEVTADTLLVWGEHDPFGEPAYGAWLAERLRSARLAVISGAAHHPQSELPETTAALVRAHLA